MEKILNKNQLKYITCKIVMSTSYFILTKLANTDVADNTNDDIINFSNKISYVLPRNLLLCYADKGLFESYLIDWCKQYCSKDANILDIGAHTGSYALSLSSHCKKVYAFEPQKMTYYALCGGVALSNIRNVECINKGLGCQKQVGKKTLHIISNDGGGSSIHSSENEDLDTEEIEIVTLDSLNIENVSFIKMDVENNEQQVLEGGLTTIKKCNYPHILFECNDKEHHIQLFTFLEELNYSTVTINGVNNMYLAHH